MKTKETAKQRTQRLAIAKAEREAKKRETKSVRCKFERNLALSHKEITDKRSAMLNEDARLDSTDYMRVLLDANRKLQRKLANLEDFHADSTTTLKVTADGFDSKSWIEQMNETKYKLFILSDKIAIANAIHNEYFG